MNAEQVIGERAMEAIEADLYVTKLYSLYAVERQGKKRNAGRWDEYNIDVFEAFEGTSTAYELRSEIVGHDKKRL